MNKVRWKTDRNAYHRQWTKENPEKVKESNRRKRSKPYYIKLQANTQYKRKYGITVEQYELMLKQQNHVCMICLQPESSTYKGKVRKLSVDHCHISKYVRGLLCQKCNAILGLCGDQPIYLQSAIAYLLKFSQKETE